MDGQHHHQHPDPDLKIFVIAILGIVGIIIGPAIAAAMWIFALALGVTGGLGIVGLVALAIHRRQVRDFPYRKPVMPPNWKVTKQLRYDRRELMQPCTINRYHSQAECNGYHMEISDT